MEKKLSFVLPIYNVARYLPQCLDSILSQCTEDCETILVDDGSTDGSGAVCDAYGKKYENVKVLHKENGGLSSARNAGFDTAVGEYVCFVDSDDYIAEGSVAELLRWTRERQADIVFLRCDKVYPGGAMEPMADGVTVEGLRGKPKEEALEFLANCPKYPASAWAKLWRRQFLLDRGLRFPADRRLSEDLTYCLDAFLAAERFDVLECPFYRYRQGRADSITKNVTPKYYFDTTLFVTDAVRRFSEKGKPIGREGACALAFAAFKYVMLCRYLVFLDGEAEKRAYQFLKEYRWVLQYGRTGKTLLTRVVSRLLGLRLTARLLDIYVRIHKKAYQYI